MKWCDLKPTRESFKYRDTYGRLLEVSYYKWLTREWFKKTEILEDVIRR